MATTTSAQNILHKTAPMNGELPDEFWELINRYRSELVNQAFAILGDLSDAEDVVQVTFCDAFRDRSRIDQVASLGPWLRAINKANALTRLRSRRSESKRVDRKQQEDPQRAVTTGGFSVLELRESIAKAIEPMPEEFRSILVLRYWEQLPYAEISERLGIPQITVRRRLCEAEIKLYRKLKHFMVEKKPT